MARLLWHRQANGVATDKPLTYFHARHIVGWCAVSLLRN